MLAPITIRYPFRAARRSLATAEVHDLFGLDETELEQTIAENLELDIRPDELALFTGASGSGKSSLLREVGKQLGALDATSLELPDVPLVEALGGSTEERLSTLSACGLGEARLLLRTPRELSDGQRARFRIAYAYDKKPNCLMLDEFGALLDRTLAKVLAFNLRKLVTRTGIGALCATTHEDLVEDLNPDIHVRCEGDGIISTIRGTAKKNEFRSPTNSGSPRVPTPIGRISLGGITGVTASVS